MAGDVKRLSRRQRRFESGWGRQMKSRTWSSIQVLFWLNENPQLGWGFKKAFSFTYIVKTPFDLLALSCGLATAVNNKSKGGHYG